MKYTHSIRRVTVALLLLVAFLIQGTWALAGTTGSINGTVVDETGAPIAGATVSAVSPSQSTSTTTDSTGHFLFLSLAPDSYTVSVSKDGYTPQSLPGVTVFADQTQTLSLSSVKALTQIAHVSSSTAGSLVKAGTTSDVYSVNAATQKTLAGIGGGYNLNSAYSAIYSQPGVTSYIGNYGQGQVFYIRGASYGQTGYEFDGVPVNRAFDNYGGSSLSSLGQQELQVYTGGSPSSGTSATLGGYINQVIKTGTYPGFGDGVVALGYPGFYHNLQVETGGASPNRLFSYYFGFGGYNQVYLPCNMQSCTNYSSDGMNPQAFFGNNVDAYTAFTTGFYGNGPFGACPNGDATLATSTQFTSPDEGVPTCQTWTTQDGGYQSQTSDREVVANFHFGIPHKSDGGRDDLQLLYDSGAVVSTWNDSVNDVGGLGTLQKAFNFLGPALFGAAPSGDLADTSCYLQQYAGAVGYGSGNCPTSGPSPFAYSDGYIWPSGTKFGQSASGLTPSPYYFPSSPTNRALFSGIPLTSRGSTQNDVGIVKLQYQKNLGSNAYARLYGYTFYSDWLMNNPEEASLYYELVGLGSSANGDYPSPDYEETTQTRGVSFEYANQINTQNLVRFTANYVTATLNRFNNQTWLASSLGERATSLTNGTNCYSYTTGAIASCFSSTSAGTYGAPTRGLAETACGTPALAATAACTAAATWEVTRPSGTGTTNGVTPKFTTVSLEDDFRPNDKLDLDFSVRLENYAYDLVDSNNAANNFWFNAADNVYCYDPVTLQPILTTINKNAPPPANPITTAPGAACPVAPSGQPGVHPNGQGGALLFSGISPSTLTDEVFSPRVAGTYTLNPDTVLRFSAGRFSQPTAAAFEQYLNQYGSSAASSDFSHFFGFGFTNPSHDNPAQVSNNFDFSLEKRLKGTDVTFKLSPFYRDTRNQSVTVPLGPNFVSAVNLGHQISDGVEFQISKGDPTRDGWSGAISYTYTQAKIQYGNAPNGTNAVDTLNNYITAFNGLTQAGGGSPFYCSGSTLTPPANGANPGVATAAACTGAGGAPIANPYYTMASQPTLDRNAYYDTYPNQPPEDAPAGETTAVTPNTFTGWVQFKKDRWSIAPNFILDSGNKYGGPTDLYGTDPRTCADNEADVGVVAAGSPVANDADFYQCGATLATASGYLAVPNPFNGNNFETVGQYTEPWQLNIGAQIKYDISPKVNATLTLANLYNACFGGSSTAWSSAYPAGQHICGYGSNAYSWTGTVPGSGFFYGTSPTDPANGTAAYPKSLNYPYTPFVGDLPLSAYLQFNIKI